MDAQTDIIAISYRASLCYFYVSYLNVLEVTLNTRHRRHSLISCCVSSCQCPLTTRSDRRAGRSTGPARKMIALFHPPRRTRRPLKLVARLIACRVAAAATKRNTAPTSSATTTAAVSISRIACRHVRDVELGGHAALATVDPPSNNSADVVAAIKRCCVRHLGL